MTAPAMSWVILPVNASTSYTNVATLTKYASLADAKTACLKAALGSGIQYIIFEAKFYAEPTVPAVTADGLLLPVV